MKHWRIALVVCLLGLLLAGPAAALTIKLGSLAPEGSPWDLTLKKMGAEWRRISGGRVDLKIYPGGIAGNEQDMIRKMRIRQLDAAALTGIGIHLITPNFLSVQLPMMVETDEELDYVMEKMSPLFERELEEKGFQVVLWTMAGWARFFAKSPVVFPADMKPQKMHVQPDNPEEIQAWKAMGFRPVPIPITDMMTSLQSGMTEAFAMTPLTAAALQWFALAPNMSEINWAPMLGGLVISTSTWQRIPADLRPRLLEAASRLEESLRRDTYAIEQDAIAVMKQHGLKIHPTPPGAVREWRAVADRGFEFLVGRVVDRDVYEQVKGHLAQFRSGR